MLRSNTLMLDNKLCPLYQERLTPLTSLTFTAEHNNEQLCSEDDDDDEEQSVLMTGTGRRAGKYCRINQIQQIR